MDLQRLFLFLIFAFSLVMVWDGWQRYQHPEQYVQQIQQNTGANKELPKQQVVPSSAISTQAAIVQQPAQQVAGKLIHVKTDILEAEISSIGGDISYLALFT